ncbi:hypothetical protein WG906_11935 [Pedobacter sp. P351]|uniref:hypothetical protein n=1 Tax=Pedobacter superstes TaxID=3133441 RepID=UPI0030AC1AC5
MIPLYPDSKIYIFCTANFATGGPEALHQLAYHLKLIGHKHVFMYYLFPDNNKTANPVHPFYKNYNTVIVNEIENRVENLIILPETYLDPVFDISFSEVRKAIWWLSVTNYYKILIPQIRRAKRKPIYWIRLLYNPVKFGTFKELKKRKLYHIAHSYFSQVHLLENGINPDGRISDYMNQTFFKMADKAAIKEDLILYNPKKNDKFLQTVISHCPDLTWIPLIDMSPSEIADWMNRSKVYIDFGYHPGKERMPREACIMKCCLIIGKEGSAKYPEDMPIPEQYKFEKDLREIGAITKKIYDCLNKYEETVHDFDEYRSILFAEEERFEIDIQKTFQLNYRIK